MDLPAISISDLENHYVNSGHFEIQDDDLKELKKYKNQIQTLKFAGFAWVTAFIFADIKFNSKKFSNTKAWFYLGARLPYIGFHCLNAFTAYTINRKMGKNYFDKYIDVISKYDKQARILKYREELIITKNL